ncbi:hypothetical protein BURK2_00901 [Burkholderiales bacterium]|nr:hypothetical protein BURK2_00901 [Burkholderiales bacterium]
MNINSLKPDVADPIPLSALNPWSHCLRRCCLILMEVELAGNIHSTRGTTKHARTGVQWHETSGGRRVETALPVWSDRLGRVGKCDVVEFLSTLIGHKTTDLFVREKSVISRHSRNASDRGELERGQSL